MGEREWTQSRILEHTHLRALEEAAGAVVSKESQSGVGVTEARAQTVSRMDWAHAREARSSSVVGKDGSQLSRVHARVRSTGSRGGTLTGEL